MKIIIKIGTAAIFDFDKKEIKKDIINSLAKDSSKLIAEGNELIIVSSGAVGCGKNIIKNEKSIGLKQAQFAVGQVKLMEEYSHAFSKQNLNVAQFLLTSNDLNNPTSLKNIKETYRHLKGKIIPIVNENDLTSLEELSFGDNDFLASLLLLKLNFDILIILTEIGVLIKDKKPLTKSNLFLPEDYDKMNIASAGFGGLKSKLNVAKKIIATGKECIIAKAGNSIQDILSEKVLATRFILTKF
ncbi:MAG: hypothetical protein AABX88_00435 [Nanoarchaeota archaeon]